MLTLAHEWGFEDGELAVRAAQHGLTSLDWRMLRTASMLLEIDCPLAQRSIYEHVNAVMDRDADPEGLDLSRLIDEGRPYTASLPSNCNDPAYLGQRIQAGVRHYCLGLAPKLYAAASNSFLIDAAHTLEARLGSQHRLFLPVCRALAKLVSLDVSVMADAYALAGRTILQEHNAHFSGIIRRMPLGLVLLDSALCVCSMNLAARVMFGFHTEQGLLGRKIGGLIECPALLEALAETREYAGSVRTVNASLGLGGSTRHFEFHLSETRLEQERVLILMVNETTCRVGAQEKSRRFRAAVDTSIDAILLLDRRAMRIVDANTTAASMLGYTQEELLALGPHQLRTDLDAAAIGRHYDAIMSSEARMGMRECVYRRKDGSTFPVEVYLRALNPDAGPMLVAVVRDITDRINAAKELRDSEERFRATFSQAAVGLAHISLDGYWLRVNHKLCSITGYAEAELLQLSFHDLTHPADQALCEAQGRMLLAGSISDYSNEKRYIRRDGTCIWVNVTISLARDGQHTALYYIAVIEDISQRKEMERQAQHLASHDALTGLANRALLRTRLAEALAAADQAKSSVAVMFVDMDRLKLINDSLGHEAGDRVIVEVGRRLSAHVRPQDTVARLGGDEFVIVASDLRQPDGGERMAVRILEALQVPMPGIDGELISTCSIGISVYPQDGIDGETLLKHADTAMYRAKEAGGSTYQFYAPSMNARMTDRLKLEARLRRAVERGEFTLLYQPQIDTASGTMFGVEALVRWTPPGQAAIPPADFIPIAEETGLIVPIGEWVLRAACGQSMQWRAAGLPSFKVAVNLSARQFKQECIVDTVSRTLRDTGCCPTTLQLEITESAVMDKPECAAKTMQQLRKLGVQLAIDDFGTGYSSLSYLKRFPINCLKVDHSFIRDVTTDSDDASIVKAVIGLAHDMKMDVVAEGVETYDQVRFLQQMNCQRMQGFYFSTPVCAEQISAMFAGPGPCWPEA